MEVWKDIPGYEGIYQASNRGRIRTSPNKTTHTAYHGSRTWRSRVLKSRGKRYYRVALWKDGKMKEMLVARLVAFTFYEKDINDHTLTVNHIDGDKFNNCLYNLELISLADNLRHAFRTGLMHNVCKRVVIRSPRGEFEFRSLGQACKWLNRSESYITLCLKNGWQIKSKSGEVFSAELLDNVPKGCYTDGVGRCGLPTT